MRTTLRLVHADAIGPDAAVIQRPPKNHGVIPATKASEGGFSMIQMPTRQPQKFPRVPHSNGFNPANKVGISSVTVGWICTVSCMTV